MNYKNYTIEPDNSGYAPKNMLFGVFKEEEYIGSGGTVEECKKLIDENIIENFEWTDESVIDFVNWSTENENKDINATIGNTVF